MNNTALGAGANKAQNNIIFISDAHEKFYYEKLKEVRYQDVYHKALCYCLGISDDTRRNIKRIYDFKTGCVKTECLHEGWQTSGSVKVVRMAFNLYCNGTLVAKGEYSMQEFIGGIEEMVRELVQTYHSVSDEQKSMFGGSSQEIFGKCPKCGGDVVKGKFGAYCKNKCGMNVARAMGAMLSDSQIISMLEGKKTLVKGLRGKKGSYDAYLIPEGIEDYSYTKDGKEIKGSQYKVKLEFLKKKK